MKKIILIIILILGIAWPLRELYLSYRVNGFPKFNIKAFIGGVVLFLIIVTFTHLLLGDFITWLLE